MHRRALNSGVAIDHPCIRLISELIVKMNIRIPMEVSRISVCAHTAACFMRMEQGK